MNVVNSSRTEGKRGREKEISGARQTKPIFFVEKLDPSYPCVFFCEFFLFVLTKTAMRILWELCFYGMKLCDCS